MKRSLESVTIKYFNPPLAPRGRVGKHLTVCREHTGKRPAHRPAPSPYSDKANLT